MKQFRHSTCLTARTCPLKKNRKRPLKNMTAFLLAFLFLTACFATLPASAASTVRVKLDGKELTRNKARIIESTTYVPFRLFCSEMENGTTVTWNARTKTATAKSTDLTITATVNARYITKNGTRITSSAKNRLIGGTLYIPVRPIASAYGYGISWDAKTFSAVLTKQTVEKPLPPANDEAPGDSGSSGTTGGTVTPSPAPSYSESDLYWLSRIIEAEAGGESYRGKLAVGTVVMNRVSHKDYPNTVYGVIFDRKYGVQFTPAANGHIYCTPSADSIKAAKEVLEGYRSHGKILYFLNPALASDAWFERNLTYVFRIGNHVFYAP